MVILLGFEFTGLCCIRFLSHVLGVNRVVLCSAESIFAESNSRVDCLIAGSDYFVTDVPTVVYESESA